MSADVRNWAGNVVFSAQAVEEPRSVEELQAARRRRARSCGPSGTGHSFSRVADTTGTHVSTRVAAPRASRCSPSSGSRRARRRDVCRGDGRAARHAGGPCTTSARCRTSASPGPAPPAPTGPGTRNGSLSTAVAAVELVRGDGELVRLAARRPGVPRGGARPGLPRRRDPAVAAHRAGLRGARRSCTLGVPTAALLDGIRRRLRAGDSVSLFTSFRDPSALDAVWVKRRAGGGDGPAPTLLGVEPSTTPQHPVPGMDPRRHDDPARHGGAVAPPAAPLQARVHAERGGGAAVGVLPAPRSTRPRRSRR